MKKILSVLVVGLAFSGMASNAALVLDVNPNQAGDWVFQLTGSHNGSGIEFFNNLPNTSTWNGLQGGSSVPFTTDGIENFKVYPVNSIIVDAFDVGDGVVVGDINFKGLYVSPSFGFNLKLDASFGSSISDFTSTTFDETLILKPSNKNSFTSVWNEGNYTDGDFTMNVSYEIVPEPAAMGLLGSSCIGLFMVRSLRRRKLIGQSLFPIRQERSCDHFCSESEWSARNNAMQSHQSGAVGIAVNYLLEDISEVWSKFCNVRKVAEKRFWNYMVARYERRRMQRKAFKTATKKKALNFFDAFLALIMK